MHRQTTNLYLLKRRPRYLLQSLLVLVTLAGCVLFSLLAMVK